MPFALVAGQSVDTNSGTNATTALASLPGAPTNGNLVVVQAVSAAGTATVSTVSDAGSTIYSKQKEVQSGVSTVSLWAGIASSGTANFTVTWSVKINGTKETSIAEFSGNAATVTLDGTPGSASGAASDTDPARTGTVSTSLPDSLVVGAVVYQGTPGTEPTLGSGWNRIGAYNNNRMYSAYKIETSTESAGTNMASSFSRTWAGAVVAYQSAAPVETIPYLVTARRL